MQSQYDVIIIGAGVVGCMTARWLSRYALKILLIEKASDVCTGATAANSALVHAGHDAVPGTLKAAMNVKANPMWDRLSHELQFSFARTGAYIVTVGADEYPKLAMLLGRAQKNGVPAEIISAEEMRRREPAINPDVSGALFVPTGGICDPWGTTIAAAENAVMNGVELRLETEFQDFLWS
ncbi:MAG: FAD-dependent oxidoreductase, partial [Anaerolineae bacterium]|nr:FAD-dependent oxidoreductase [Anaerolineae bacterium]